MAEAKKFEYIIEFEPYYMENNKGEMCFKSRSVKELVRCKDCKYYGRVDKRRFYRGADCLNGHLETIVPESDYCSRGERRDG